MSGVIARKLESKISRVPYSFVDGSILDGEVRVVFYSADRFAKELVAEDRCFICGRLRTEANLRPGLAQDGGVRQRQRLAFLQAASGLATMIQALYE